MKLNLGMALGGALKGYGEGLILDGKQRHERAMEMAREQNANARHRSSLDSQESMSRMREEGDNTRSAAAIKSAETIAREREKGENARATQLRTTQQGLGMMQNAVVKTDEESGDVMVIYPDGTTKSTGVKGAKAGQAKINEATAVAAAIKANRSELDNSIDWGNVGTTLELMGLKDKGDIVSKAQAAAKASETLPAEADEPGFWSSLFGGDEGSYSTPESVGEAMRSGQITRSEAERILREKFPGFDE